MKVFDPVRIKDNLLSQYGGLSISHILTKSMESSLADIQQFGGRMESIANAMLARAIAATIVGYDEYVPELLKKCGKWLDYYFAHAIEPTTDGDLFHRAVAHFNQGMLHWMTTNRHDSKEFEKFRHYYMKFSSSFVTADDDCLDDSLVRLTGGQCYEEIYNFPGLENVDQLQQLIKNPKKQWHAAYVNARSLIKEDVTRSEALDTVSKFLHVNMSTEVLGRGDYEFAAAWVKEVYWVPGQSALESLKRVYEFMPKVKRP